MVAQQRSLDIDNSGLVALTSGITAEGNDGGDTSAFSA
jgi:hypothetical protein